VTIHIALSKSKRRRRVFNTPEVVHGLNIARKPNPKNVENYKSICNFS